MEVAQTAVLVAKAVQMIPIQIMNKLKLIQI